jgi:mRNA interferase RelE/StbE
VAYEVRVAPAAEREIRKLGVNVQAAVLKKLEELAADPRPVTGRKVQSLPRQYEVYRVVVEGSYRIVYQVRDEALWVLVLRVADRKDVYKRVGDLKRLLR